MRGRRGTRSGPAKSRWEGCGGGTRSRRRNRRKKTEEDGGSRSRLGEGAVVLRPPPTFSAPFHFDVLPLNLLTVVQEPRAGILPKDSPAQERAPALYTRPVSFPRFKSQ